ncbi:16S rRNA (guanine(966)-N(2))-methyltransferase RsmD [Falsiroseomonas sp.]|uniref:16S rRNA (guanine(966)-N(2))-methyltransferase RsmD n=1 Tax=Falsiroseomonas sp. TaxID=2870721 RepID=UPI00271D8459|nr:16S rRNA (guanine(966)-N(2))-methyltransferase RsmD [Falsiroseomonas sp.]MDO9501775.1 16S rRNA (guanine(966)-N(2))-methyltransferase RsmD [Falsiroseomonas sp.]
MLRLVAGLHRGRRLAAPPGETTRPTSDRVRQAVFDMLLHAPWAGESAVGGQRVLDAFAGSGALGLEALSRGAAHACFLEQDRVALAVLRQNVAALKEEARCTVLGGDVLRPRAAPAPCGLVLLDPPYGRDLVPKALVALASAGWIAPGALVVAETGREEALAAPGFTEVAAREHGAARVVFLRAA